MASTAVVVGAGPAGCLVSSLLASRGWKVEVFERRSAPQPAGSKGTRGYPMRLTDRSLNAIEAAGLELDIVGPNAQRNLGPIWNGKKMPAPTYRSILVDRQELGREMYKAAAAKPVPGSITWHWNQSLDGVDFNNRTAVFSTGTSAQSMDTTRTAARYDLLIGADGYQSAVRSAMQQAFQQQVTGEPVYVSDVTYKTCHGLPEAGLLNKVPDLVNQRPRQHLLSFMQMGDPVMFTFWKADDGTLSGMMGGAITYEENAVRKAVSERLAGCAADFIEGIVSQLKEGGGQEPARFGQIVKMSQLHGPHCVLLGDAAHCVTSTLGQGCNLALESVRVFIETLDRVGVEAAPAAFTRARLADAHAMQTIEFSQAMNFVAMTKQPQLIKGKLRLPNMLERCAALAMMVVGPTIKLSVAMNDAARPYSQVLRSLQMTAGALAACGVGLLAVAASLVGIAARAIMPA